ncbi:MAG: DNA polymerase III subunit beta [Muribaculaceae bacterium]|nr:DNA polymerase III subunit beta [Muribaculaceae bacterium]
MKFKIHSKSLYNALSTVSKVINSKNAMTILNNFLFEVDGNWATITASDLENILTARVKIEGFEGERGSFCVDARRCVELFKELPELNVDFIVDSNLAITIEYPGDKFNFVGINGDEYPTPKQEAQDVEPLTFECPVEQLVMGIDNTLFAVGSDDLRPQMMGILFDIKPDYITFVATDTRKLVRYTNSISAPGITASCIIPVKPATIIKNAFAKEEKVTVKLDTKSATIESETFTFNCRFIKGVYPDYNRVIPTNNPYSLTIDRHSMLNALRRVGVFVDPGHGLVKFRITPENLEMKAQDNNFCTSGRVELPCSFTGNEMIIGFSAPYLIEICNTLTTDNIVIKLSDPSRPGVFIPEENAEGSDLLMLLMPMTVNNF